MSAKYTFLAWDTPIDSAPLKLALLQLANNADDNGFSFYSISKMALACGMSERTFQRKIVEMEEKGILTVERRSNRPSLYNLIGDEMGVTLCHLQSSGVTESHAGVTDCRAGVTESYRGGDRESLVPNSTPNTSPKSNPNNTEKPSNDGDIKFLTAITNHWNEIMTTQPRINLLDKTKATQTRIKSVKKILKDYPNYSDAEYFQGYFYRLATLKDFEWQRENKQVTFDQATNLTKFTRNVELMRMEETA